MNVSAFIRDYMAKNHTSEDFLIHVAELMEKQLHEWDDQYEVFIMHLKNYEITIKNEEQYYHVALTNDEIRSFQKKDAFALDRHLWTELKKKGLPVKKAEGNYLNQVFNKKS